MVARWTLMGDDAPFSLEPVVLLDEVFPGHTNALDTLFGGRLMSIMDTAAGMCASKFAHREFVTVSIDALNSGGLPSKAM